MPSECPYFFNKNSNASLVKTTDQTSTVFSGVTISSNGSGQPTISKIVEYSASVDADTEKLNPDLSIYYDNTKKYWLKHTITNKLKLSGNTQQTKTFSGTTIQLEKASDKYVAFFGLTPSIKYYVNENTSYDVPGEIILSGESIYFSKKEGLDDEFKVFEINSGNKIEARGYIKINNASTGC